MNLYGILQEFQKNWGKVDHYAEKLRGKGKRAVLCGIISEITILGASRRASAEIVGALGLLAVKATDIPRPTNIRHSVTAFWIDYLTEHIPRETDPH